MCSGYCLVMSWLLRLGALSASCRSLAPGASAFITNSITETDSALACRRSGSVASIGAPCPRRPVGRATWDEALRFGLERFFTAAVAGRLVAQEDGFIGVGPQAAVAVLAEPSSGHIGHRLFHALCR